MKCLFCSQVRSMSFLAKQNIECKIAKVPGKAFMADRIVSIGRSSVLSDLEKALRTPRDPCKPLLRAQQ